MLALNSGPFRGPVHFSSWASFGPWATGCIPLAHVVLSQKIWRALVYMNWTVTDVSTRLSQLGTAGWTVCFLRTNWYCMRGSSQQGLQHAFDRFSAACYQAGTKISTETIEVFCLSRRPRQCILQLSGNTLQHVEMFMYLGVVFTSGESRNKGIHKRIDKTNAGELYCSVVTKRELSKTAKLSLLNRSLFRSSPVVINPSGDDWKNAVKRTNGTDGILAKSS